MKRAQLERVAGACSRVGDLDRWEPAWLKRGAGPANHPRAEAEEKLHQRSLGVEWVEMEDYWETRKRADFGLTPKHNGSGLDERECSKWLVGVNATAPTGIHPRHRHTDEMRRELLYTRHWNDSIFYNNKDIEFRGEKEGAQRLTTSPLRRVVSRR